jgi:Protein of unknown function (DUF3040)
LSLSHDEERAFREIYQRLGDVRHAFARRYTMWQARLYAVIGAFVVGTLMFVLGVVIWWPLSVAGGTITLASCLLASLHGLRCHTARVGVRPGHAVQSWKGLMG